MDAPAQEAARRAEMDALFRRIHWKLDLLIGGMVGWYVIAALYLLGLFPG